VVWLGPVLAGHAGVIVKLAMEHGSYVQFEKANAFITLHNDDDNPFLIRTTEEGKVEGGDIDFVIERRGRRGLVRRIRRGPIVTSLGVMPDTTKAVIIDVGRWFDLSASGTYLVRAQVRRGGVTYTSKTVAVEVVPGIELVKVTKPVPGYNDRVYRYSLRYWTRGRREYLFVRMDNPSSSENMGVFLLGRLLRVTDPVMRVDRHGKVVVVHQSGPKRHTRSQLQGSDDMLRLIDQTYHLPNGKPYPRPSLKKEKKQE
jgi:hypothetical protein